jgi:hypothetical protein
MCGHRRLIHDLNLTPVDPKVRGLSQRLIMERRFWSFSKRLFKSCCHFGMDQSFALRLRNLRWVWYSFMVGGMVKKEPLAEHWRVVMHPKWQLEGSVGATRQIVPNARCASHRERTTTRCIRQGIFPQWVATNLWNIPPVTLPAVPSPQPTAT